MVRSPPLWLSLLLIAHMLLEGCAFIPQVKKAGVICVRDPITGDIICTTETVHEPVINAL